MAVAAGTAPCGDAPSQRRHKSSRENPEFPGPSQPPMGEGEACGMAKFRSEIRLLSLEEIGVPEGIRTPDPRFRNAPEAPQKTSAYRKVSFNFSVIAYRSVSPNITWAVSRCPQIVPGDSSLFSSSKRVHDLRNLLWGTHGPQLTLTTGLTDPLRGYCGSVLTKRMAAKASSDGLRATMAWLPRLAAMSCVGETPCEIR